MGKTYLDTSKFRTTYTFYKALGQFENYFCKCGHTFQTGLVSEEDQELQHFISEQEKITDGEEDMIVAALKSARMSLREDIKCPKCNTNYQLPENHRRLKEIGSVVASGYFLEKTEEDTSLHLCFVTPRLNKKLDGYDFFETKKTLRVTKKGRLFFTDINSDEVEFDLDKVFAITNEFFKNNCKVIINLFDLHNFLIEVSKYVADIDDMDSIPKLLGNVNPSLKDAGTEQIKKVLVIYFSIIKYSNLSTIALTKDATFLYDLLKECKVPSSVELKEAGVTSPLEIFNFLAQKYFQKINDEISEDRKQNSEFVFKSDIVLEDLEDHEKIKYMSDTGDISVEAQRAHEEALRETMLAKKGQERQMTIKVKSIEDYEAGKVIKTDSGSLEVFQLMGDGKISKYLYKKIKSFGDYKQLLKYLKLFRYHELMEILQKYDIELLTNMINSIYHRDGIELDEVKRLIPLFTDHCLQEEFKIKMATNSWSKDELKIKKELTEKKGENENLALKDFKKAGLKLEPNFKHISSFDFVFYDDSVMMNIALDFDPRRNFYKIKTVEQLRTYHDKLVRYYNVIRASENVNYEAYFSRFKFLEEKGNYSGPLEFGLLDTPTKVSHEGEEMHHSGGHYFPKILEGRYLMLKVQDTTEGLDKEELTRFTLGLNYNEKQGLSFDQFKSYANKLASNRLRELLKDWMKAKEIDFNPRKPDIRVI